MSYMVPSVFTVSLSSGATLGSSVDLGWGWERVYLQIPTMASGDICIQGSNDNSTFNRIVGAHVNTATAFVFPDFKIPSSVTQRVVPVPAHGIRYVKIENTTGCTDVVTTFNLICS